MAMAMMMVRMHKSCGSCEAGNFTPIHSTHTHTLFLARVMASKSRKIRRPSLGRFHMKAGWGAGRKIRSLVLLVDGEAVIATQVALQ